MAVLDMVQKTATIMMLNGPGPSVRITSPWIKNGREETIGAGLRPKSTGIIGSAATPLLRLTRSYIY